MIIRGIFLTLYFIFGFCFGDELTSDPPKVWDTTCQNPCLSGPPLSLQALDREIIVDLLNPFYENGVLTTLDGGVLTAPGMRIQAKKIVYTRQIEGDSPIFNVYCEGDLLIDYQEWVLVGDQLYFDFVTQTGYLIHGRAASPPWYLGGKEVLLLESGCLHIVDGTLSTSEGEKKEVVLGSPSIIATRDRTISARHINLRVENVPIFWLPFLNLDLKNFGSSPFAVKFGWGGFLGSHVSLLYRFLSWREFQATARLDAFIRRGIGGGIETAYDPKWAPIAFYTRNYVARDIAIYDPKRRNRYRFQGTFYDRIYDITINGMYDVVSDAEFASDYQTKDFELNTAERTELQLRKQTPSWIANLFTQVRVNSFQSVNQELPTFQMHFHPTLIPYTGLIFENMFKVGYLNYVFSDDVENAPDDLHSARFAVCPKLYRPFYFNPVTLTPRAGFIGIAYSNSPGGKPAGQAVGDFGVAVETALSKCLGPYKHVIEPYADYQFLTHPKVALDNHFIFTIQDGYHTLNLVRFGIRNSFFVKTPTAVERPLWIDLWANAFFDTKTLSQTIPKGYLNCEWKPFPFIFVGIESGLNFQQRQLDFGNGRIDWTINENLAMGVEFRHRGAFDWRKADFYNFILESTRTIDELLNSPLSDRRDTLLFRIFMRPHPDWTLKLDLRNGFNRKFNGERQPSYLEYQAEASTLLFQHWRLTFICEHRESDTRYSCSLKLDPGPP